MEHGTQLAITVISVKGDVVLVEGNVNGEIYLLIFSNAHVHFTTFQWLQSQLLSSWVMDNASTHHIHEVAELIIQTGALLHFLPPYSPNLNPVEQVFSKVKAIMKKKMISYFR